MLGCISSVPSSYGLLFIMQGCFCAIDIIMWFLSFIVYMLHYIYWFAYIEPSLNVWNETKLIMVYDFF
jgi:hypothetical protein